MPQRPAHVWMLPSDPRAAAQARRQLTAACADLPEDTVHTACLLASELVTNAVVHAHGRVVLSLARDGDGIRVEVRDESRRAPVLTDRAPLAEHGAGLQLVDALADTWGTSPRDDGRPGKSVWFVLT